MPCILNLLKQFTFIFTWKGEIKFCRSSALYEKSSEFVRKWIKRYKFVENSSDFKDPGNFRVTTKQQDKIIWEKLHQVQREKQLLESNMKCVRDNIDCDRHFFRWSIVLEWVLKKQSWNIKGHPVKLLLNT